MLMLAYAPAPAMIFSFEPILEQRDARARSGAPRRLLAFAAPVLLLLGAYFHTRRAPLMPLMILRFSVYASAAMPLIRRFR